MKLTTKDFTTIAVTAIIIFLIIIGYNYLAKPGNTISLVKSGSERITWDNAQILMKEYKNFKPLKVQHKKETDSSKLIISDLQGFVFNASDLYEIIEENRSGEKPDEVIFYFGKQGEFTDGVFDLRKNAVMHIIAVGMKGKKLLTLPGAKYTEASIFDKADPCPPNVNCPTE